MQIIHGSKYLNVFRGTLTGLRISSVDGTAFVDNLPQAILDLIALYPGGLSFEPYDSSNRKISGVLKAAGSAETLDSELISTWTNHDTYPYDTFTLSGGDITRAVNNAGLGFAHATFAVTSGNLYKRSWALTVNSGQSPYYYHNAWADPISVDTAIASGDLYRTSVYTGADGEIWLKTSDASDFALTGISLKKVLTPSTSGATIVSAKGGTTYNFAYKNASFTYNAASYYVIVKLLR